MKQLKSLFSNILKISLLFVSSVIFSGALTFVIGESFPHGIIKLSGMAALIATVLLYCLPFVLLSLLMAIYFRREYKRNKVSWNSVFLITILAVITTVGLCSFGPFLILGLAAFTLCIITYSWKCINRYTKTQKEIQK